jgi:hypothetical protein
VSATSDYTTQIHSVFLNSTWNAADAWKLYLEWDLTASKAQFDAFQLPDPNVPAEFLDIWDNDFSQVQNYSDLKYTQNNVTLGAEWKFSRRARLYGYATWMDLVDDQQYVYGDLTGSLLLTSLGMTANF